MYSSMHPLRGRVNRVERTLLNFFSRRCVRGGFLGFWDSVLRGKSGRRRGADGRFCREIPRFLSGARARRGDSVHGGHRRALGAKKFLKIFKKGVENLKIGVREVPGGGLGAPYRVCGVILGLEAGPLAAMLGVHFVQVPQPQASATRFQRFIPIYSRDSFLYIERVCL